MSDDRRGFRQWRRQADDRVRRLNKADLDDGKVVAFRPRKPETPVRAPWRPGALTLWAAIIAVLLAWYVFDRFVLATWG